MTTEAFTAIVAALTPLILGLAGIFAMNKSNKRASASVPSDIANKMADCLPTSDEVKP